MLHSKKQMGYQAVINLVMILVTLNVLIRNGYSFFPGKDEYLCVSVYN